MTLREEFEKEVNTENKAEFIFETSNQKYISWLESKLEAFRQCNVSGRSEQLPNTCECDNVETYNGWGNEPCCRCLDCGRVW